MHKEFLHCLRIQFPPNHHEDERIEEVVEFCQKFGFKNVMLFINAEEYHVGHMTKEEALPWLKTIKKAKKALESKGISVSLNPWSEMGHLDRKRQLKQGQNFTTQVDYDGNRSDTVACPTCNNWKKYFLDFYKFIISEVKPNTVWIEDDFRLHNHGDLKYGGCFCDLHMKRFNQKLGTNYTREEFTDRLFRKKNDPKVKKAWLDVNRECMVELANDIGDAVRSLGLNVKIGLMSSTHEMHATEGRDWHGIHKGLKCEGVMINRLHLPCYYEVCAKNYYFDFNRVPYVARALLPTKTVIYPELENGSFSSFTKDSRFLKFQLESAIPLCIEGMTYDIFDFVGNGTLPELKYGEAIKEITPYLNGVLRLNLKYQTASGIILPIDEKTVYKSKKQVRDFDGFRPKESVFGAYIASLGFATKVSTKKKFINKIIALGEGNVYNFTKTQLEELFKNNYVILEGGAVKILIDMGLGYLIGANSYKIYPAERDVHSYEQVADGVTVNGKAGYRASAYGRAGDYYKVDYESEDGAKSFVYSYTGDKIGVGDKDGGNYFVIPYAIEGIQYEQYNALRVSLLKDFIDKLGVEYIFTDYSGVYAYLYKQKNRKILLIVNSTVEDFSQISLKFRGYEVNKISALSKKSGKKSAVKFSVDGNTLTVNAKLEGLSTQTLIIE